MGTLYYRKDIKKWTVRIRYKGFKEISMAFTNLKDANKFLEKSEQIVKNKKTKKKEKELLIKLKRGKNASN